MLTKDKLISVIDELPEEFSIDDLVEQAILLEKIERGLKDSEENNVFSMQEMQQKVEKWFAPSGK